MDSKSVKDTDKKNIKSVIIGLGFILLLVVIYYLFRFSTLANYNPFLKNTLFGTLKLDEEAYGKTIFDSSFLNLKTILDKDFDKSYGNVIYIPFYVGGGKDNDVENPFYDIALQNLEVDCDLLSPYVKWKLKKNGKLLEEGSLDYQFDTVKDGRFVLTTTQQDLVSYHSDKSNYDYYEFYLWLSDSCQEEDISKCENYIYQNNLLNKKISGKIEVELYAGTKKELVRTPSSSLDFSTCVQS